VYKIIEKFKNKKMASTLTSIVAAKKLSSIKKNYKLVTESNETQNSPETERKLKEKIEKDVNRREKQKQKREDLHQERDHEREKLRTKIRDKYGLNKDEPDNQPGDIEKNKMARTFSIKKKESKKLKEKDFYKYNKAMPSERGKKIEREIDDSGKGATFATMSETLARKADEDNEKKKGDCIIS